MAAQKGPYWKPESPREHQRIFFQLERGLSSQKIKLLNRKKLSICKRCGFEHKSTSSGVFVTDFKQTMKKTITDLLVPPVPS